MRKFIWWGTAIAVGAWSVFSFLVYSVIDFFGSGAAGMSNVPGFTPDPYSFGWFAEAARSLGLSMVFTVWLVGTLGILLGAFIGHSLTGRRRESLPERRSWGSSIPSSQPGPRPDGERRYRG
jgi:hypothetical protein